MRRTILGPLPVSGADEVGHLSLHQLLRHRPDRLADHITVLLTQHPADDLLDRHPLGTGHRWRLLSSTPWNEPTIMSATVAGTTSATPFRPNPTYTTLRDVTCARRWTASAVRRRGRSTSACAMTTGPGARAGKTRASARSCARCWSSRRA